MRRFALCLLLLVVPLPASAGGLFTPDVGSIGLGRGGAWTGRASDVVGALYYNPAGLWQVDGWTVSGGLNLHRTHRTFQRADGPAGPYELTESTPHVRPIPEVGIAWGLPKPDLTIALGLYAPPAPIQRFDPDGPGRYRLIDQELIQGNIALAVALRPVPWLSFGASFQLLLMELTESFKASAAVLATGDETNEEDPDWDVTANFTANSVQPYFNVGVMVMPLPWLRIGVSFEPPYKFNGKGHATLDGVVGTESSTLELLGEGALHVVGADDDITITAGLPGHLRFGIDLDESRPRFDEGLEQTRLLLENENVSAKGQFHSFTNTTSLPRPTQKPRPPFWVAAVSSPESFAGAARMGHGVMGVPLFGPKMKEMMGIYRDAWKEAGHPGSGKIMLMFHMFCWPDETEAHDLAREHINDYIASFADAASDWVSGTASDAYPGYDKLVANLANDNFENTLARGAAWVGTPKTITEQIRAFQNDIGDIEIGSFQVNFSEMPVELAEQSLENFSRDVMPHFKD